jgi:hypothetical protein
VKYWENHRGQSQQKVGSSWGCVAGVDTYGRTIFVADAHGDGKARFIVHGDQKLTAFLSNSNRRFELATSFT